MTFNENEQVVYDSTVKIYSSCIKLLAQNNLFRFEQVDLGLFMYGSATPEKGTWNTVSLNSCDDEKMVLGMACADVRNSLIRVVDGQNYVRADCVPLSSLAVKEWSGEIRDLWPCGWLLPPRSRLYIEIKWNGEEKPGILTMVTMLLGNGSND